MDILINGFLIAGRIFKTTEFDKGQYDLPKEIFWASGAVCKKEKIFWGEWV